MGGAGGMRLAIMGESYLRREGPLVQPRGGEGAAVADRVRCRDRERRATVVLDRHADGHPQVRLHIHVAPDPADGMHASRGQY